MPDSQLKTLHEKMLEHITDEATTTIVKAGYGFNLNETSYPYAELFFFSGGQIDSDNSHILDEPVIAQIRVYSKDNDECEYALEQLKKYWYDNIKLGELINLGCIAINPATIFHPQAYRGTSSNPIFGDIYFEMTVRDTYQ